MSLVEVARDASGEIARLLRQEKYKDDPVLWAEEYLGIQLWSKQKEILYSIRDNRNTAVAAGHGVGKSHVAGVAVAWWVDTHPPEKTFVATTAPSASQVNILWDNVRRFFNLALKRYQAGIVDHPLPGYITGDNKWKLGDGSQLGQGRKPPDSDSDVAFQGRHADYLFAIGDEAVGLNQGFLDALGNIATGPANRQLLLANPTNPGSPMAELWDERITTWNRMHISVFDSPAVTNEDGFTITEDMSLSGWDYIEQMKERWGEDHPIYVARVKGQWAFDSNDLVFSPEQLASAQNTVVVVDKDEQPRHGWDISGEGPDYTVGYELRKGVVWLTDETGKPVTATDREGYRIRRVDKWNKLPLVSMVEGKDNTTRRIHNQALEHAAEYVTIDVGGIGKSVMDGLVSLEATSYQLIDFLGVKNPSHESYENLRAEMFFLLRDDMVLGRLDLDPEDTNLINELSGVQYEETRRGKLKIEGKREMRSRGMKSPDHADACTYARFPVELLPTGVDALPVGSEVQIDPEDYLEEEALEYGQPSFLM